MANQPSVTAESYYIGSEYDFVIFSTVRSVPRRIIKNKKAIQPDRAWIKENLGFVTDRHQICVGITRARHGLIIVGKYVYNIIATWLYRIMQIVHGRKHFQLHCPVEIRGKTFTVVSFVIYLID